jgi:D-alanyl-D-alanine carboxypeptidase
MRVTKRNLRQARAVSARGSARRPPARHGLRPIVAATGIALVVSLSPDLTHAPTRADEPGVASQALQAAARIVGVEPSVELSLPPARPPRPVTEPSVPTPRPIAAGLAERFQAALDSARFRGEAYGVTFAAVRDGRLVWAGSSGVARDGRTLLEPGSSMVVGSVTKTFVAASILQLAEEGRLALDDSVRDHLPEMRRVSREVTIRQLLDHTSGLADVFNDATRRGIERRPERAWSRSEVLATLHAPWYEPGEGWAYANTNYMLLGMIVERLTGSTLEAELQRRFIEPMGLSATRTLGPDDPTSPLSPAWTTIFWASGNMSSSAADLARWGDALYDDDVSGSVRLEAETRRQMMDVNRDDYGLGVKRLEVSKRRIGYGHTGLLNTYTTLVLHLPAQDTTVAMLVNRTNVDLLALLRDRPIGGGRSLLSLASGS